MKYFVPAGRLLYSLIFLMTFSHLFSSGAISHAASSGVPYASVCVPLAGVLAVAGGLSITLGFRAKAGAIFIILFLIPVTFLMHAFWKESNPQQMHIQMSNFLKNISMLGAAIMIANFGSGPFSLDNALTGKKMKVKGFITESKSDF